MTPDPDVDDLVIELLPRLGEASPELVRAIAGGQPGVLTYEGLPAVIVIDLDSWREVELALDEGSVSRRPG